MTYSFSYLGTDYLIKTETGEYIHIAENSTDPRKPEAIAWLEAGNTPTPYYAISTWQQVRTKRNQLLQQSDWTQLEDVVADKEAWQEYRKQLRNITENFSSPIEVVWPELPK